MSKKDQDPVQLVRNFLKAVSNHRTPIFLGIDPGAEGAIGMLCGHYHAVVDIPVLKTAVRKTRKLSAEEAAATGKKTKTIDGKTTVFDFHGILDIFEQFLVFKSRLFVGLEEAQVLVGPRKGRAAFRATPLTGLKVGIAYGMWLLYFASCGYSVDIVKPVVWKKSLGLIGKDKNASRLKALSLWPSADIKLKQDHNRAEAMLLAEYVRRLHGHGLIRA